MSASKVDVHELIAWQLDEYSFRRSTVAFDETVFSEKVRRAQRKLALRKEYTNNSPFLPEDTHTVQSLLDVEAQREDLHDEYSGLDWSLGVIDLRRLLAFQRRLVFDPARSSFVPPQHDWGQLIAFTLGSPRSTRYCMTRNQYSDDLMDVSLHSSNPDLQVRLARQTECSNSLPFALYGGSPCFEVAKLRERWFLRDGYHRAYRLLQVGIYRVPAVIIHTQTIEELGATEPWFFDEDQLFSNQPPLVTDFLDADMVLHYERAALRKVIRIRIEESLEPSDEVEKENL